ncbi:receptor-type tyrosine-protein phosphatase kappa [Plakobranchus ocellatus]|uniref:Receptor-type tyrosine-protein phosphatase kappa n=1 Tax=Plakobranchus ocellatus TaxID=259542 RepID=A0AAV4BFA7_9GAST|nr:receptor-type tyrosine-protein phosphatase kappa [Plakobranchus ocellatus]
MESMVSDAVKTAVQIVLRRQTFVKTLMDCVAVDASQGTRNHFAPKNVQLGLLVSNVHRTAALTALDEIMPVIMWTVPAMTGVIQAIKQHIVIYPVKKAKCPIGKYGPGCSQTCSNTCKGEGNPCHHIDGGCLQGCDPGYQGNQCKQECTLGTYGQNCSEKCNENCGGPNNTCDHINGTCTDGCDDGYRNAKCDTPCARGKYGSACSQKCSSSCAGQGNPCHHVDGRCSHGCDPGYWGDKCWNKCYRGKYGPGCSKNCSVTCTGYKNPCHHVNGECSKGCDVGFVGSYCKEKCPFGKFGLGCSKNCSIHCAGLDNVCHHVDGTCTLGCDAGYKPAQCNMTCDPGTYGKNCSETCSEHCSGEPNTCNNVEGTCVNGCDFGYLSPMCKLECPPTKYGQDCKQDCGEKCLYNECDHVTGKCSSCVDGYKNDFCEQECNATTYGSSCNQSCSTDCVDQLCHHVTGKCYQFAEQQGAGVGEATIPALICVILIILVATLVLVAVIIWRRHKEDKHGHAKNRTAKLGRMTYANLSSSSAKRESSAGQARSHVVNVNRANEDNTEEEDEIETADSPYNNTSTAATAIAVQDLKAYLHQHSTNSHFKDQFMAVPMETGRRQRHGLASHNSRKNRYKNIIPYDHTRVLLFADEDNDMSNYINASHVKDYYGNAMFIASQAPNETILADFVRMLWEQGVDRVVMLTNLIELGKRKCTMYWPEDSEEIFGDITVQLLTTRVFAEYTIRHLRLSTGIEPPRDLTHFHFTAWPDKSVPENPWGLVDFYHRVMASPGTGPLLVHCSAGVGRTGTFIALCNLLEEAKATGKMNFRTTLFKLRQDRMHMIQTAAQYTFLHKTALVAHMTSGTTIQVQDIAAKFHSLEGGASGDESARSYQEEFDDVAAVCDEDTIMCDDQTTRAEEVYGNEKVMANKCKDRLSNILPNSTFRPILSAIKPGENTYINAVLVPNLTRNNQDILTQLPLPSTVTDFWRLVTQFNVRMVVAFEVDSRATDETIAGFLPETDFEKFQTEEIEISSTTVNENSTLKHMSLAIQEKETQGLSPSSPELTCLLCKNTSLNPESVLELVEKIQSCRPTENYRTVYMCRNGAEHSGLVCILSILLDRLKVDNCLTVPLVVGAIKAIRPQVIPTVDQYKCLYQVLRLHYEEMNVQECLFAITDESLAYHNDVYEIGQIKRLSSTTWVESRTKHVIPAQKTSAESRMTHVYENFDGKTHLHRDIGDKNEVPTQKLR